MQIDRDYEAWRAYLAEQYQRGPANRAEYERQLQLGT
jgi:hypothetical protein